MIYQKKNSSLNVVELWVTKETDESEVQSALRKYQQQGICYCSRLFKLEQAFAELTPEERYEKRLEQEKPVLDALLSWANEMQAKTAPKSALGRAIGSAPFLDFASKAYRKKARKAIHQVYRRSMAKQKRYHQSGYAVRSQQARE